MASVAMFEKTCSLGDKVSGQTMAPNNKDCKDVVAEKVSCQDSKCALVAFDSLPGYLQDNEFILNHYRSEWPLKQTILSIFSIHNETLNIWTHLIGFLVFLSLTILATTMFQTESGLDSSDLMNTNRNASSLHYSYNIGNTISFPLQFLSEPVDQPSSVSRWPFFAFLFGAMLCLLSSSACHLLMCHSEQCAYRMLRLDYMGISALIVTSFYPLVYYTFTCDPRVCALYIGFITLFGLATVVVSFIPIFQTVEFRPARAMLFACMAVSGLVPIVHKVVAYGDRPEAIVTAKYEAVMGLFYGVGVVVYATRVPERWLPGRFDLVGHSHQLFHVLVIAGAYTHYLAGLQYLRWRDMEGC